VWAAFWTFGGIMAMKWLIHPGPSTPRAFISLWLTFWFLAEVWAIYSWLWTAFGKEIVTIGEGEFRIKRNILGSDQISIPQLNNCSQTIAFPDHLFRDRNAFQS
jgi:hypothetical protein